MRIITDLHLHSKYSRACSKDLDLAHNDEWARIKGIDIVGTGDFTHPKWFKELEENLVEEKPGLFKVRGTDGEVLFMLTTELSCIYSQGGKTRRIHICVFAPNLKAVDGIIKRLEARKVNLRSDGRPIMGLSSEELTKIIFYADEQCTVIPAHIWTPWFSMFGSNSGYNTVEECFGSMSKHIFAIETGLSSDPIMNWRLSQLDKMSIISNSDAHSPANLGREATVFEIAPDKLSYFEWQRILREQDQKGLAYTIEFFPEEGKYHIDGHRACDFHCLPQETKKLGGICPKCKKKLVIGVLNRADELADRPLDFKPKNRPAFKSIIPLPELIASVVGKGKASKAVTSIYFELCKRGGNEFAILMDLSREQLSKITEPEIVAAIMNVRDGRVTLNPGYDGVYGTINALGEGVKRKKQGSLL